MRANLIASLAVSMTLLIVSASAVVFVPSAIASSDTPVMLTTDWK